MELSKESRSSRDLAFGYGAAPARILRYDHGGYPHGCNRYFRREPCRAKFHLIFVEFTPSMVRMIRVSERSCCVAARADVQRIVHMLRPAGSSRMAVYCTWGPPGCGRVIERFLADQLIKVPRPDRAGHAEAIRRNSTSDLRPSSAKLQNLNGTGWWQRPAAESWKWRAPSTCG